MRELKSHPNDIVVSEAIEFPCLDGISTPLSNYGLAKSQNDNVVLNGWIDSIEQQKRVFVLRTAGRYIEVFCDDLDACPSFRLLKPEFVVSVTGAYQASTGGESFHCSHIDILNTCDNPPFVPRTRTDVAANLRSRYRYLEFRDPTVHKILRNRHQLMHSISCYLDRNGFISIETPILATPSGTGANEFRVSSLKSTDLCYALPQSSQIYGQLAVIGGVESYYQWARCFRDEDLRSNRQLEFTQLHLEAAFVNKETLMSTVEGVLASGCSALGITIQLPLPRIAYDDAIRWFGSDKPDLRFDLKPQLLPFLVDESSTGRESNLILTPLPSAIDITPDDLVGFREVGQSCRFRLLGFLDPNRELSKRVNKPKLSIDEVSSVFSMQLNASNKGVPIWLGQWKHVDKLRQSIYSFLRQNKKPGETPPQFLWVDQFPLFALDPDHEGKIVAENHPFTAPTDAQALINSRKHKDLLQLKGQSFDLVVNGEELGSGSILIHQEELQRHVLNILGFARKDMRTQFGFILDALRYGAPPMGGFGLGFDRLVACLCGMQKIREVIAYPKTKQGYCPVTKIDG
jgi:aspartyl-tRNA synthetase